MKFCGDGRLKLHSNFIVYVEKRNNTNTSWYFRDESRAVDSDHFIGHVNVSYYCFYNYVSYLDEN